MHRERVGHALGPRQPIDQTPRRPAKTNSSAAAPEQDATAGDDAEFGDPHEIGEPRAEERDCGGDRPVVMAGPIPREVAISARSVPRTVCRTSM